MSALTESICFRRFFSQSNLPRQSRKNVRSGVESEFQRTFVNRIAPVNRKGFAFRNAKPFCYNKKGLKRFVPEKERLMTEQVKVLIVEHNHQAAWAMVSAFREKGWEVASAGDAVMSQTLALKTKPDIIVINSQVPGGGGVIAISRLRSSAHTAVIPVIAIVGQDGGNLAIQKQQMVAVGAQESIEYPVNTEALCAVITKQLDQTPAVQVPAEAPAEIIKNPERIRALEDTGLLDTAPEESFDSLTALAARLLDVPTVLVSLVDKDRQFFKSHVGLPSPWAESRETPLSHSFCQWVVSSGETDLTIEDARNHPVLKNNLAVRDLGVNAYAGVPLEEQSGQAIGSFCAINSKPHVWTEDALKMLRDFANVVEAYIYLKQIGKDSIAADNSENIKAASLETNFKSLSQALGTGINSAARILRCYESSLTETDSRLLLTIIEHQSGKLIELN
jgi:DNA-binding response OmpR family regulator